MNWTSPWESSKLWGFVPRQPTTELSIDQYNSRYFFKLARGCLSVFPDVLFL